MTNNTEIPPKGNWSPALILVTIGICTSGTLALISAKITGTTYNFKHSMIQTLLMFIGEYLNILLFSMPLIASPPTRHAHFDRLTTDARLNRLDLHGSSLWVALPSLMDAIGSGLGIASLLLLPASISLMLQGGQIISTCVFAKIINKQAILTHQIVGVMISTVGFLIVGLAGYISAHEDTADNNIAGNFMLGIFFILINLTMGGLSLNIEELIMNRIAITPQRMVGLEGIFGLIWMMGAIGILSYLPCLDKQLCDIRGYTEDVIVAIKEIGNSNGLIFWSITYSLSVTVFNFTGMYSAKHMSSVFRIFWSSMVIVLVWIACLVLGFERFGGLAFMIQAIGFSMLVLANFTYNGFVKWPCVKDDSEDDGKPEAKTNKYVQL